MCVCVCACITGPHLKRPDKKPVLPIETEKNSEDESEDDEEDEGETEPVPVKAGFVQVITP